MLRSELWSNTRFYRFVSRYKFHITCPWAAFSNNCALLVLIFAATAIGLAGCASVNVQRGKDLATAGVEYTKAATALVDVAVDAMINSDSEQVVLEFGKLDLSKPLEPKYDSENLEKRLEESNADLLDNMKKLYYIRTSLSAVEGYFDALQTLANNPQGEATAAAVNTLSDRVNALNNALHKSPKAGEPPLLPLLSDSQKAALSGLSKVVSDQIHGALVGAALRRDAPIIGEALLLQEQVLSFCTIVISGDLEAKNSRFFAERVNAPYKKHTIDSTWVSDRNTYLKAKAISETCKELQTARAAAQQMSKTWEKILSGQYDVSEMLKQIEDIKALVTAIVNLQQAEKPKDAIK